MAMNLRRELAEAIRDAEALLEEANVVWLGDDESQLEILAEIYDNLAARGDAILAHAGQLHEHLQDAIEAHNKAVEYIQEKDSIMGVLK